MNKIDYRNVFNKLGISENGVYIASTICKNKIYSEIDIIIQKRKILYDYNNNIKLYFNNYGNNITETEYNITIYLEALVECLIYFKREKVLGFLISIIKYIERYRLFEKESYQQLLKYVYKN